MFEKNYHYFVIGAMLFVGISLYKKFRSIPPLPKSELKLHTRENTTFDLDKIKTNYLLISYFQSWCGDCIKESPSIAALQKKVGSDQLTIIMVTDEDFQKVDQFQSHLDSKFTFLRSEKKLKELGIHVFPTTYLLNKKREIVLEKMEGFDWNSQEVWARLK
jgi:thiol-disulfide isomerase/thioredoxin